MTVILAVAAAALLAIAVMIGPDSTSILLRVIYLIAVWSGPLVVLLLGAAILRPRLASTMRGLMVDATGPTIVRNMPPRAALEATLGPVWGDSGALQEMLTAILGGAGRHPAGYDTAVSRETTAHFRLESVDAMTCLNEFTWTYDLSSVHDNHKFVIFATDDQSTAGLIARERVFPLYELWLLREDILDDFVPGIGSRTRMGITYRDIDGAVHKVPLTALRGNEVAFKDYGSYVRFPGPVGRDSVQIVEFNLHDLADPEHVVEAIETLTLQITYTTPRQLGYITWSPPHPCFVSKITFDVEELAFDGEKLVYLLLPSFIKAAGLPSNRGWEKMSSGRIELGINAWMLPAHGVTLLWRPVDGSEPEHGDQRW
jgi:hypothetical protein